MRVLVTGGAGRLGINVCKTLLRDGSEVRLLDLDTRANRKSVKELEGKAEISWGDVTSPEAVGRAVEGADAVVHMAAVLPWIANERPELAARVNVGGTRTVVEAIRNRGSRMPFVFTSSTEVFGSTPTATQPISIEKDEPHPENAYAQTKFEAENLIKESGVDYLILRLSATMYTSVRLGDIKHVFMIPLNNRLELCHPDDVAFAIQNSIKHFSVLKQRTLVISSGPSQRMTYGYMIGGVLGVLGLPLPPARKFSQKPYPVDWYDTSESQRLLRYQRNTLEDLRQDVAKTLAEHFSPVLVPFMRYFMGPVFGRMIVRFL